MSVAWSRTMRAGVLATMLAGAVAPAGAGAAPPFVPGEPASEQRARDLSRAHVEAVAARAQVRPADLVETRLEIDELATAHRRLQQTFRGVPVHGGEAIVHLARDGALFATTDDLIRGVRVGSVAPGLSRAQAVAAAVRLTGSAGRMTAEPEADLRILRHDGADRLVYRVRMERLNGTADTTIPVVFVDAGSGAEVMRYDDLQTGTGPSLYSGTIGFGTYFRSPSYRLQDLARQLGIWDFRNGTTTLYPPLDSDDVWDAPAHRAAIDAHHGASKFYDYLKNVHGRSGIDGANGPTTQIAGDGVTRLVSSRVHYAMNYNNAFWNGSTMTYGDGDGSTFGPLVSLDIVGHEMFHGVTERTAALVYSNESGALSESWSDVFGAMVERYANGESANTWKFAEQAYTPANGTGDALRFLDNPHANANSGYTADDDPDHYSERYTGTLDNGGVHVNAGIATKAFYLLAKGGAHHRGGSMTGIGADAAARIWFRALTSFMTSSTDFAGARSATINAATALYGSGSANANAVSAAWCLVGVGSCPSPTPPPAGSGALLNGGFEQSVAPWALSGQAFHVANGGLPMAGTGYVYLGSTNSASGTVSQAVTVPSPATGPRLTFGLNVASGETTTTTQYDRLFVEVRNSAGMLLTTLATASNLDKATAGAYTTSSFDMSAYRGHTIRIQFRATTDSTLPSTFRIDQVALG